MFLMNDGSILQTGPKNGSGEDAFSKRIRIAKRIDDR